ncbi:hypothetical protein LO762_28930 [Actinocorallia sp. API 0066]|uniref:hypothetical protein n=1 Tax=Actinocorallia sp. API 0066 TaxID=2896846 RepID=UPI001E436C07|nr:hypothetical protein [Actinocorallia sp. API 0066]MCD0453175.1 hypothetical protein [Actinocorallia sp. API 0066]
MPHKTDPGALVAGVFFLTVAALFTAAALTWLDPVPLRHLAPALATGFALVLLIRLLTRSRRP